MVVFIVSSKIGCVPCLIHERGCILPTNKQLGPRKQPNDE
jgi:hypothetical protein